MTTIIAILMALGLILSPGDFKNLDVDQQEELMEIVITDETNI